MQSLAVEFPLLHHFPVLLNLPQWNAQQNLLVSVVVQLVLLSALLFYSLYLATGFLSQNFVKAYRSLEKATQIEWDTRVVSTLHAVISTCFAMYLLYGPQRTAFESDPMHYFTELSIIAICITNGYLLQDMLLVIANINTISSPYSTIIHHMVGLISMNFGAASTFAHYFCLMFISTEASTPLVNSRWYLHALGKRDTKLYLINGIAMILAFFFARILMIPGTTLLTYAQRHEIFGLPVPFFIACMLPLALIAGHCLNTYWFWLMLRGLSRILFSKKGGSKKSAKQTTKQL